MSRAAAPPPPSVQRLIAAAGLPAGAAGPRSAARALLVEERAAVAAGAEPRGLSALAAALEQRTRPEAALRRVINATGVVLHTNLGRAPLAPEAVAAVVEACSGYCDAELDLETGARGGRGERVLAQLRALTGAPAALVVNNNAAAVLLALTAVCAGRAVLVSRGELVEIGGSFRVPEVISAGGARLVEVGTTNRTRLADYAAAVSAETGALLRVHPSNFSMQGFVERPARAALAALAADRGLPLIEDLGAGLIGPSPLPGADGADDAVEAALAAGVDLLTCSGDKLLGGPQAGIIVGRADLVERCRRHPLYRALRVDKMTLAALGATLALLGRGERSPTAAMLAARPEALLARAEQLAAAVSAAAAAAGLSVSVEADEARAGGGSWPGEGLPGPVVALRGAGLEALARALRQGSPAVLPRTQRGALRLDPRAMLPGEVELVGGALLRALAARRAAG